MHLGKRKGNVTGLRGEVRYPLGFGGRVLF